MSLEILEENWIESQVMCDNLHINYVECSCGNKFQLTKEIDVLEFIEDKTEVKEHLYNNPYHRIIKTFFHCLDG